MARSKRRRNPMPTTGAVYLVKNGRRRNAGKRKVSFKRVLAKLRNGGKSRRRNLPPRDRFGRFVKVMRNRRRNGLALRTNRRRNGLALRTNGRKHNRHGRRKNGLALRTNGRRRNATWIVRNGRKHNRHSRRHNGLALRTNGRGHRRNGRRRNTGSGMSFFSPVTSMIRKVPVIGPIVAAALAPALGGALVVAAVHFALKYGAPYIPASVAKYVVPVGYTLGGVLLSVALAFVPASILSASTKGAIATIAVTGGAAVDAVRYLSGATGDATAGMGDGGLWELGADDGMLDGDEQALQSEYGDVTLMDAAYCGEDLDGVEGEAALAGPRAWRLRFPMHRRLTHTRDGNGSKHSKKHGHRWGWLVKLVGFKRFQAIAAAPPEQRIQYIKALREFAINKANEQFQIAQNAAQTAPATAGYGALIYAQ